MEADEKQNWALVSPSSVAFRFDTSGLSVAMATAITHPLDTEKWGTVKTKEAAEDLMDLAKESLIDSAYDNAKSCWT
ncbi:hypothetical protein M0R45_033737 [Rubus argutus]|uniref:Uncharacterized protein n=1 Tax=Rubus argutus TaxID=59490 RepID=A0AAW1WMN8_RUBAR